MIPFAPDLTFLSPERFALLLVPLLFAALYLVRQRRRRAYVVRYTDLDLIDAVAPQTPGPSAPCRRRRLPDGDSPARHRGCSPRPGDRGRE